MLRVLSIDRSQVTDQGDSHYNDYSQILEHLDIHATGGYVGIVIKHLAMQILYIITVYPNPAFPGFVLMLRPVMFPEAYSARLHAHSEDSSQDHDSHDSHSRARC